EALTHRLVLRVLLGKHLDDDLAPEKRVGRAVDVAHAAAPDLLRALVAGGKDVAHSFRSGFRKENMLHIGAFASLVRVLAGVTSMRRTVAIASILLLGIGPAAHARANTKVAAGAATFVVTGHGWGHGVGMSQYGAYGYAQKGIGYEKIVLHYFVGTELGQAPVSKVRVLLTGGVETLPIGSASDFRVKDATGAVHDVTAGEGHPPPPPSPPATHPP